MSYEMCSIEKFYREVTFLDQFVYYRLEISRGSMGKCDASVQLVFFLLARYEVTLV